MIVVVTRRARFDRETTEDRKNQVRAYHKGLDQARMEIIVICVLTLAIWWAVT